MTKSPGTEKPYRAAAILAGAVVLALLAVIAFCVLGGRP